MTRDKRDRRYYVFDFDSTLVQVESLPELARVSLKNHPERAERLREVERITELTATGKMSMAEGIAIRIELLNGHRKHLDSLARVLKRSISPSVKRNRAFFKKYRNHIYVLSNGFREFIVPIAKGLGLREDHVFANGFLLDGDGYIVGFDSRNPLIHQNGKARVLRELGLEVALLHDSDNPKGISKLRFGAKNAESMESVSYQHSCNNAAHRRTCPPSKCSARTSPRGPTCSPCAS